MAALGCTLKPDPLPSLQQGNSLGRHAGAFFFAGAATFSSIGVKFLPAWPIPLMNYQRAIQAMTFSMMNPSDPIQFDGAAGEASGKSQPAQVLTLMYSTLSDRLARAAYTVAHGSPSGPDDLQQARAILADVRESIDPAASSATVKQLRLLLTYVAERLALSDDRVAALREARNLIDPIASAFAELADADRGVSVARVLHS